MRIWSDDGSARRSSVYTSGRQSLALNAFSGSVAKDTRPIRQSAFQAACIRNISEYLLSRRCPIPLGPKTFTSPTTKDFQSIFRFLIQDLVDPGMVWSKKFEDDAINLLKDLRYPAMETIGRTGLGAPGGRDWPPLLAMLSWMIELCKVSTQVVRRNLD